MTSLIEFALFAWVAISVIAVLVQLVRIARYKRAARAAEANPAPSEKVKVPSIDLNKRLADSVAATADTPASGAPAADAAPEPAPATVRAPTIDVARPQDTTVSAPNAPAPSTASASATQTDAAAPVAAAAPTASSTVTNPSVRSEPSGVPAAAKEDQAAQENADVSASSPTLADLLAGVRLPRNLLPTVDRSREPSNDRVVLITEDGEPADIGVDIADELERLGFAITPRGDDVAIASNGSSTLGLQIIPDPHTAVIDGEPRFPSATAQSVALDIWIE